MNYTPDELVDTFLDHIKYFSIAHHIPGRIRVKASLLQAAHLVGVNTDGLEELVDDFPGITSYRLNKKGLSAVIEYDQKLLPPDLWEEVAAVDKYPRTREAVRERLLGIVASLV